MTDLPTGTVTFLFTDIQGSTRMWQEQPRAMLAAHGRHDEIVRAALEANGGYVFQVIGDAFCAAFGSAADAVRAALASQLALRAQAWGETPIYVRMGLHTGPAEMQADGQYRGYLTMSRVSRLMAAGHGGQILISAGTHPLVLDDLPDGAGLRSLGDVRLKDMAQPEPIFQLTAPGLTAEFPPLKALDTFQTNLPAQLTSFIGREEEVEALKRLVAANRLVTLTGPGGTGKTRLSLEAAAGLLEAFPSGAWLVELAPLTDPATLPQTLANVLSIPTQSQEAVTTLLVAALRSKRALLIFDNCEHVLEASARLIETLLQGCPQLRIMASSREALGMAGEIPFRVQSLRLPDAAEPIDPMAISSYEAVRLFVERAQTVLPGFAVTAANAAAVVQVCRRLDGIPLALELAAARVKMLRVEQIAARLDDRFRLLTGGSRTALPRQQTLRALIDWSYDLLSGPERAVLQRLSVFSGGWTLEAAEAVGSDPAPGAGVAQSDVFEILSQLANKSLVVIERQSGEETRYRLLETIRQYARDRLLESQDGEPTRNRHLDFFLAWVQQETSGRQHTEPEIWVSRLELEHDNLRAALEWAFAADVDTGIQLLARLGDFWLARGFWDEGLEWYRRFLAAPGRLSPSTDQVRALAQGVSLAARKNNWGEAQAWCEACLSLAKEIDDQAGLALAYYWMGRLADDSLDHGASTAEWLDQALTIARSVDDKPLMAEVLYVHGHSAVDNGQPALARQYFEASLGIAQKAGLQSRLYRPLQGLGLLAYLDGNLDTARQHYEAALVILRKQGDTFNLLRTLSGLIETIARQGDYAAALAGLNEAKTISRSISEDFWIHTFGCAEIRYLLTAEHDNAGALRLCRQMYEYAKAVDGGRIKSLQPAANIIFELTWWAAQAAPPAKALRLAGAFEANASQAGWLIYPIIQTELACNIGLARQGLDDAAVNIALAEGRAMTLEQAIEYALA